MGTRKQLQVQKAASIKPWYHEVPRSSRASQLSGYAILIFGVMGFTGWASTAPIEGAIVASGVFVATSQNKIVQHLEGGIIKKILVREGQHVEEGQPLVLLDETQARADLRRLIVRNAQLLATAARLDAEAEQTSNIKLPPELVRNLDDADIAAILKNERSVFQARRQKLLSEIKIIRKSIRGFEHRIAGHGSRLKSASAQENLIKRELVGKAQLFDAGLVRKPDYYALRRAHEKAHGEIGHLKSQINDYRQRIAGAREEIGRAVRTAVQAAVEQRNEIRSELKDIRERITAKESVLNRITINAPVKGIVVKLNYHTAGGVIRPGNDILALLPEGDELVIEARVRPQDIDNLKKGQQALVRLTALSQRVTPMVPGHVIYVSADALPNDQKPNDDNVYIARIQLDQNEIANVKSFRATPGMPTEVYIKTGDRTFFQYLIQPVIDTMTRAFRES